MLEALSEKVAAWVDAAECEEMVMPGAITAAIDAAAARVALADGSARNLASLLEAVRIGDPPTVSHRRSFGGYEWIVDSLPSIPQDVPLLISTALHHCRAALDNLMWASVKAGGGSERTLGSTYFPLLDDERLWYGYTDEDGKWRRPPAGLSDVPEGMAAIFRSVQPFTHADHPVHPMRALRLLSNADKHRFLVPAASAAVGSAVNVRVMVDGRVETHPFLVDGKSPLILSRGLLGLGQRAAFLRFPEHFDFAGEVFLMIDWVWGADAPDAVRRFSLMLVLVEIIGTIETKIIGPMRAL